MKEISSIKDLMYEKILDIENTKRVKSVSTGFYDLDYTIKGLHNSSITLVSSRPAMGKTSFVSNIATHIAIKEKIPVAIFSLECSKQEYLDRIIAAEAMVKKQKLNTENLDKKDLEKITIATKKLEQAEIYIDDTPFLQIEQFEKKCKLLKAEKNIGLIVIDYLQLFDYSKNKKQMLGIWKKLNSLSKELNLHIIVLSQLSRATEQRENHRPRLYDFGKSIDFLEYVDTVLFLYRDYYYNKDIKNKDIVEIIIAKNKYGSSHNIVIELKFIDKYLKFENINKSF